KVEYGKQPDVVKFQDNFGDLVTISKRLQLLVVSHRLESDITTCFNLESVRLFLSSTDSGSSLDHSRSGHLPFTALTLVGSEWENAWLIDESQLSFPDDVPPLGRGFFGEVRKAIW